MHYKLAPSILAADLHGWESRCGQWTRREPSTSTWM